MTAAALPKPKSKTEAKAMYEEDRREWMESYFAEAEAYVNNLTHAVTATEDPQRKHLMDAVALHVPTEPGLGNMQCITCRDAEGYGIGQWPCETFTHLAQGLDLDGIAEMARAPVRGLLARPLPHRHPRPLHPRHSRRRPARPAPAPRQPGHRHPHRGPAHPRAAPPCLAGPRGRPLLTIRHR